MSFNTMTPPIQDQVALVTGANAGMGLATVRALLDAGYRVAATDLRTDQVASTAESSIGGAKPAGQQALIAIGWIYSMMALPMSSMTFLASPNTIMVLSM